MLANTTAAIDDKTRKLLLKLRKGADASLSLSQLFKVLAQLGGWTVEAIVGLTPIHYTAEQHKDLLAVISIEGEARARAVYDVFAARAVTALPASPALGESYVMALPPFAEIKPYYKPNHFGARFELWIGTPGYRVTAPTGELFEILPTRHDLPDMHRDLMALPVIDPKALQRRLRPYDVLRWLKAETSYLEQINALLGMEAHVPAAERTRENTGTCGACFRNIKLDQDHKDHDDHPTMALHGYQRPGDGAIHGRCSGGTYAPYELSATATEQERDFAESRLGHALKHLARMQDPAMCEFSVGNFGREPTVHKKGDRDWDRALEYAIDSAKRAVDRAEDEHAVYVWLVTNWTLRALPTAGSKEPTYWTDAVRALAAAARAGGA